MTNKILCIYHGNCADGFGAAWAVRHALGKRVEFHPGIYGQAPPDVADRHVLLVDFSYKRPVVLEMARVANTVVILDHHKTAADDLAGFKPPAPYEEWHDTSLNLVVEDIPPIAALFDMERSGAGMAWDFFHAGQPRPRLIDHIEDRDLWRFKLPGTREIQAAVFSYPYDFDIWDKLMDGSPEHLIGEGAAIERKHHKDIAELLAVTKRTMTIGGYAVPVASLPYTLTSDAGSVMAEGERFAACYWDTPTHRVFSLRSRPEGMDVSAIAASYGGGGHKNASGFQVPRDHELARA
jgi:oligoribonuclease NrnB/cAMP/cGMP phosphodiesterase (DHH superfamily)